MISHERATELGAAALDAELAPAEAQELAAHIADCPTCSAMIEAMAADADALAALPPVAVPAGLRERILAAPAPITVVEPAATGPRAAAGPGIGAAAGPGIDPAPTAAPVAGLAARTAAALRRRPAMLAAAASLIVAIVGGTLAWNALQTPGGVAVAPSVPPTGQPASSADPDATPSGDPAPTVSAWQPVADLTALASGGGEVDVTTTFRLASLDGTPAADLAQRVTVEPAVLLSVSAGPDGTAVLTPDEPLTPGVTYRFTLHGEAGQTLDTWAFQASQPLRVVGTVPADTETDVPLDTGIEITFDQDGVVGAEDHVTIEPAVEGRFERHGRTLAFVPEGLEPATVYTVSVAKGITVEGTDETLESDVRFQFETRATRTPNDPEIYVRFASDLFESGVATRPTLALWSYAIGDVGEDGIEAPTSVPLEIYRLPDRATAIDVFRQLRAIPRWSQWNAAERVATDGWRRVLVVDARLQDYQRTLWTALPEPLAAGWYLVEVPSPTNPTQAILQVTDVSAYLVVSDTQTLVWANDLATGRALRGATVTAEGSSLGTTADDGTLLEATPPALIVEDGACPTTACEPVVVVEAGERSAFLPATGPGGPEGEYHTRWDAGDPVGAGYWRIFASDRTLYRRTDTVNVWGAVRHRDSGALPEQVSARLVAYGDEVTEQPAIAATALSLRDSGAFTGSLRLQDVPEGDYRLELMVDGEVVSTRSIQVDRILKPAYQIEVTTGHHVYVAGDNIRVTATARFFDGTPVPGVDLRMSRFVDDDIVTDAQGTAVVRTIATVDDDDDRSGGPQYEVVYANPARAEEGEIRGASREFHIYPSHWTMTADGVVRDGRVRVTGAVHVVDTERLEREASQGVALWELDPRGEPVAGTRVIARFVEIIPTRQQVGTEYDFIEKRVVPVYQYDYEERDVGSVRLTTDGDGRFSGSIAAPATDHDYQIFVTATDPDGHVARAAAGAGAVQATREDAARGYPRLHLTDELASDDRFGIGETIDVTLSTQDVPNGDDDVYLFHLAQRGLREITVQGSERLRLPFPDWGAPNVDIGAVRFTGARYLVSNAVTAAFRATDRSIQVTVTADRERYAPGDPVALQVRTRDAAGTPLPATVMLRVVDEKLFTIDGAAAADPLGELYAWLPDGIHATYASHRDPAARPEGGDTTGGDGRDAFADAVLFQAVETGADGRGSATFDLSDDLTAWRVSAAAVTADLQAGEGTLIIPVGLPFFVDVASAPEYLVSDRPTIALRAYGTALSAGDRVTFDVTSESLGLDVSGLRAAAFEGLGVPLPPLTTGTHQITVTARTGSGATARTDRLTRSIEVIESRLTRPVTEYAEATGGSLAIEPGGDGMTEVLVTDAGAGRHLATLLELASVSSVRLERTLAADLAAALLVERFGSSPPPTLAFQREHYQRDDGGLGVVPQGSSDLEATVLAALVAPERFGRGSLTMYFQAVLDDEGATRERRNLAMVGLAGIGAGGLSEIQAALEETDLTVRERLWLGIGAATLGDTRTARAVAADLVATSTESFGASARLRAGADSGDVTEGTALLAMLLASTGEPAAARFWAYVESAPQEDTTTELQAVAVIRAILEWSAPDGVRFVAVVGGERTTVTLGPGESHRLRLTPAQAATFAIEPLEGRVGVTTTRHDAVGSDEVEADPDLAITRATDPARSRIAASDLVTVDITIEFGPQAPAGCHLVTDLVPSGLTPVGVLDGWVDPETGEPVRGITYPMEQVGQRVTFCAEPEDGERVAHLRYVARVIAAGTYTWEPTVVASRTDAERATMTAPSTIDIR
jgi:hypothetical protein